MVAALNASRRCRCPCLRMQAHEAQASTPLACRGRSLCSKQCESPVALSFQSISGMNRRKASLSLLWPALLSACGGGEDFDSSSDSLEILALSPAYAPSGTNTVFTVSFRYSLVSAPAGVIDLGFFIDESNQYLSGSKLFIQAGAGQGTLKATADPVHYTETVDFALGLVLSEDPHPSAWVPLAWAKRRIAVVNAGEQGVI